MTFQVSGMCHKQHAAILRLQTNTNEPLMTWLLVFRPHREHTLRKRRTHSARHYRQQRLIRSVLTAWHQQASDALAFRQVLVAVGSQMRQGLLSETLGAWRDVVQTKTWKEAIMMRSGTVLSGLLSFIWCSCEPCMVGLWPVYEVLIPKCIAA